MTDKWKPCGCLTDGRNWLPECAEHENVRRERKQAAQLLREVLDIMDGGSVGSIRKHQAPRVAAALLKKWNL